VRAVGTRIFASTQLFFNTDNIFDPTPAFSNGPNGYDNFTANPIVSIVTVGARKKTPQVATKYLLRVQFRLILLAPL